MEDGKNIIDATEYILLALNTITNFDEFIGYKEEIEKAVHDIRNSLTNLMNISFKYKSNNNSKIDLKYNYDAFLNEYNINKINNNIQNENEEVDNFDNIESKKNDESKINNIICNKSIRNKFKTHPKINNNFKNKTKNTSQTKKRNKLNQIADIIMKLNSADYFYVILTQLYGKDLKDKLNSKEVSDELLTAVTNSIQEIESLKKKDELNELKKEKEKENIETNLEEMEEEPRKFPINEILGTNIKYKSFIKKNKEEKVNDIYQEFDFIKNLRQNKSKDRNQTERKNKPFISATTIYGNYFDPPLQKGGISKLDEYQKGK